MSTSIAYLLHLRITRQRVAQRTIFETFPAAALRAREEEQIERDRQEAYLEGKVKQVGR